MQFLILCLHFVSFFSWRAHIRAVSLPLSPASTPVCAWCSHLFNFLFITCVFSNIPCLQLNLISTDLKTTQVTVAFQRLRCIFTDIAIEKKNTIRWTHVERFEQRNRLEKFFEHFSSHVRVLQHYPSKHGPLLHRRTAPPHTTARQRHLDNSSLHATVVELEEFNNIRPDWTTGVTWPRPLSGDWSTLAYRPRPRAPPPLLATPQMNFYFSRKKSHITSYLYTYVTRPHRPHAVYEMRPAATYVTRSVVCVSVVSCAKTGWIDRDAA